jgi:hypothetical protein
MDTLHKIYTSTSIQNSMFFPPNSSKTSPVVKYKTLKFEPRQTLKINALEHDENALEYDAQCLVACNAGEILGRYTWPIEESILFYIFR